MIKSWWADKTGYEKQIIIALAAVSLCVFCWAALIRPVDNYIADHQSQAQKMKKDIKWMQEQAIAHGLISHPTLKQSVKNIILEEAQKENLAITLENGLNGSLTIHPVTLPQNNVSRWLITLQMKHGIVIEDIQLSVEKNEEITLRHLSFRSQS